MIVVGKKIPLVGLILNTNFRNVTFDDKEGNIFLCALKTITYEKREGNDESKF
ncbi:hypothetical protein PAGU1678_03420 [Paraclostridium bifermentans subsp. muricolitidis]|nr:hypothetical protein PAGU1678_03420 [Paraclostridium bifermentans subsp. muricolitidis]